MCVSVLDKESVQDTPAALQQERQLNSGAFKLKVGDCMLTSLQVCPPSSKWCSWHVCSVKHPAMLKKPRRPGQHTV